MDFYMYKSSCPRWYGTEIDVDHIVVEENTPETDVKMQAKLLSNAITGSKTCDVKLIQKYHMVIEARKSYPSLTQLIHGKNSSYTLSENKMQKE